MPEISAADLRRFRRLESRLASAEEARTEARDSRRAVEKEVTALRREVQRLEKQVAGLVEENRTLAERGDQQASDSEAALEAARQASAEAAAAADREAAARDDVDALRRRAETAETRVEQLQLQVDPDADLGPLTADSVGGLLDSFVSGLGGRFSGMTLGGGELKLKVGFAATESGAAFVVPNATRSSDEIEALHEVRLTLEPPGAASRLRP